MGKVLGEITPDLARFVAKQPVFFVATAPLAASGHVNLSPKGLDTFRILSPGQVAYLDLTGSGNETAAHVAENGRITIMFCSFGRNPMIVRLYGRGRVVQRGHTDWQPLAERFPDHPGARQIMRVDVSRVQTSCGFGVPRFDAAATDRDALIRWAAAKGVEALREYRVEKNVRSIDGLPAPTPELQASPAHGIEAVDDA